jgi:Reverse transcriptase (RNA-dependent DNA polymerase)
LKSIYRLKQTPSTWYEKLSSYLISCDFIISKIDHSFFCKINNYPTIIIFIYVDDIIITRNNLEEIKNVKRKLKKIDIKNLGLLKYFLGIEIAHSPKGLFISQRKYVLDLLKEMKKLGCKSVSTPIEDFNHFQRLVGRHSII